MNRKSGAVMPKNLTKSVMYDIIQIYICNADIAAQHSIVARDGGDVNYTKLSIFKMEGENMSSRDLPRGEIYLLLVEINSIWDASILWPDEILFSGAASLMLASIIFFVFDMFFLVFVEKVKELYDDGYISRVKVYMVLTISFVSIELSSKLVLGSILASYGLFIFRRWRIIVVLSAVKLLAWIFYSKGKIESILY